MRKLINELNRRGIDFDQHVHHSWMSAQKLRRIQGLTRYTSLVEKWNLVINGYSIIKGRVSMDRYEVYRDDMEDPERFDSVDEVIDYVTQPIRIHK